MVRTRKRGYDIRRKRYDSTEKKYAYLMKALGKKFPRQGRGGYRLEEIGCSKKDTMKEVTKLKKRGYNVHVEKPIDDLCAYGIYARKKR